jgi:hypothetical protein
MMKDLPVSSDYEAGWTPNLVIKPPVVQSTPYLLEHKRVGTERLMHSSLPITSATLYNTLPRLLICSFYSQ